MTTPNPSCSKTFLRELLQSLTSALSQFNGRPTRTALILPEGKNFVAYDPHSILLPFRESIAGNYSNFSPTTDLIEIKDLISYPFFSGQQYQRWFAERLHVGAEGVTAEWFAEAARNLALEQALSSQSDGKLVARAISGYSVTAIAIYISKYLGGVGIELTADLTETLHWIVQLSSQREEGSLPRGRIALRSNFEGGLNVIAFQAASPVRLAQTKYVRKLLTLAESDANLLLSDGIVLNGIGHGDEPGNALIVEFDPPVTSFRVGSKYLVSLVNGVFRQHTYFPELKLIEQQLQERDPVNASDAFNSLKPVLSHVLRAAHREHFGCSIVLLSPEFRSVLVGEHLVQPFPASTNLPLVASMAKVDGALYLDWYGNVLAFACLLHGNTSPEEDRSKGARYNSAIRFTREMSDSLAIVVSSDGPVSVFARGTLINALTSTQFPEVLIGEAI